ncbi:MAG: HTTM domain-containing protein [Planctomycetaceae bacterium]
MIGRLFATEDPRPAALMRIGLGAVLLWDAAVHWPFLVELYSSDGMPMPVFPGTRLGPPALPAGWTVVLYSVLMFSLFAVAVGWRTRTSLVVAFALFAWIGLLDMTTFAKYSVVALHLLALLPFTRSQDVWSVDAWWSRRPAFSKGRASERPLSPRWPRLLMGVMVSAIYLGSAVTKLQTPGFANGDAIRFSLLDLRWGGGRIGMWLATRPNLLVLASFATVLFEMTAGILLWVPRLRRPTLIAAVLFHVAIGVTMHVAIFTPLMLVALTAFVTEADIAAVGRCWQRLARRRAASDDSRESPGSVADSRGRLRRMRSPAAYVVCAGVCVGVGFAQQHATDRIGAFRPEASKPWRTLKDETWQALMREDLPQAGDYFHSVEIGSRIGSFRVFGEQKMFRRGMTVHVVARLVERRVPLRLTWRLVGPDGTDHLRRDVLLQADSPYAWQSFPLVGATWPTGEYAVVLEATPVLPGIRNAPGFEPKTEEVFRRTIQLEGPR